MMRKYRIADVALAGFTLVGLWIIFSVQAPYRLEFKEQISIFLFGADRISWYLSNPGIISSVTGDWLTQFYINGRVAAALSCLLLLLSTAGLVRFHRLAG